MAIFISALLFFFGAKILVFCWNLIFRASSIIGESEGPKPTGSANIFRYIDRREHELTGDPPIPGSYVEYIVYFDDMLCTVNTYSFGREISTTGYHLGRDEDGLWTMMLTRSSWELVSHNLRTRMDSGIVPRSVGERMLAHVGETEPRWSLLGPNVAVYVERAFYNRQR